MRDDAPPHGIERRRDPFHHGEGPVCTNPDHVGMFCQEPPRKPVARRYNRQRPHTVTPIWQSWSGELIFALRVDCPYDDADHDKPCRLWADDTGETFQDGCWVQQELDALGNELSVSIPPGMQAPWKVMVEGSGDEGPRLVEVSESFIPRHRWWHRSR